MLLDIIWIILQESLEAGLLVAVLLTVANREKVSSVWLVIALSGGLLGSWFYSHNLATVSEWFDYVGQEVVNGVLQYSIYIVMVVMAVVLHLLKKESGSSTANRYLLFVTLVLAAVLAFTREGTEMFIFYRGRGADVSSMLVVATSGLLGLLIGVCVGALTYFAVIMLPKSRVRRVQFILLMLIAGGMVLQATQQFLQADWLPSSAPVWNSSAIVSEGSILGELLYAMFGYESTPTWIELLLYGFSLALFLAAPRAVYVALKKAE